MNKEVNLDSVDFVSGKSAEPIDMSGPEVNTESPSGKWALRDRLRSRVLWASLFGGVITILTVFGVWEKIGITSEEFSEIIGAVGGVLAAFGVLNDPTERGVF